jgi:predicted outer membrane repeat protein
MTSRQNTDSLLRSFMAPAMLVRRRRQTFRPALEALEDRLAPAFLVNSTADILSPSAGVVTLRSAIQACNGSLGNNVIDLTVAGNYQITIPPAGSDDNSTGDFNILANPGGSLLIENTSGGVVTINGNRLDRLFNIEAFGPTFTVSLIGFTITGGSQPASGGGAIFNPDGAVLNLSQMVLTDNSAARGGAIFTTGTTSLLDDVITNNQALSGNGGAIATVSTDNAILAVTDTTVANNTTAANGGGIDSPGITLLVTGSTFYGNVASGGSGGAGGGAVSIGTGSVNIANSTLFGNLAPQGEGGAVNSNFNASFTFTNCTIDGNSANVGGGIAAISQPAFLGNTIVAGNTASAGSDVFGSFGSLGHNLIGITDGSFNSWDGSDKTGTAAQPLDADLGPLVNYGGPTATQAMMPNSPAIDAGDVSLAIDASNNPLTTDQRGQPYGRVVGASVDIGALEEQPLAQPLVVTTNLDTNPLPGQLSLRQAIQAANASAGPDTITFDPSLNGQVITLSGTALPDITDGLTINGAGIAIDGNAVSGLFTIQSGVSVSLNDMTLSNGSDGTGGAINNLGNLSVTDCTLTGNAASVAGGAVSNQGTLTLTNCTLSGNNCQQQGGAIANSGTLTIVNSTVVYNHDNLGNSAVVSGGIYNAAGSLSLDNTIVAGNTKNSGPASPGDIAVGGGTITGRYNLIGDPSSAGGLTAANHNVLGDGNGHLEPASLVIVGTSPANNGGPTLTFALAAGSPAIDAGNNTLAVDAGSQSLATDQRGTGFARVVHFSVDIGSFETTATIQPIVDVATADNLYVDSRGLFENQMGGQEKWLRGRANIFGNPWYYILPGGSVYAWNGGTALKGNLLVQAGANAWENPELLVNASSLTAAHLAEVQAADQARAFYRASTGNFNFNAYGGQEVWIKGSISAKTAADQSNPWYFILPDGSVHEWSGQAGKLTGAVVAAITADPNLWKQPALLYDAYQNAAVNSGGLAAQFHFYFSRDGAARNLLEDHYGAADEKWFRGDMNSFGNSWYFLLPTGKLYAWNGQAAAAGTLLGQLNADAWNDIEKVVGDFAPALSGPATQQLITLDANYSLFRGSLDSNFSFNYLGRQEKWLSGVRNTFGNDYYYLKPDGSLTAWNGLASGGGTVVATNLPAAVYADPLLLADGFADGSVMGNDVNLNPFASNSGGPGDRLG